MKYPLIIVSLILPAVLLVACRPALTPSVMRGDIQAAADADWKRSPPSVSSGHNNETPVTGIFLELADSLKGSGQRRAQSPGQGALENDSLSDESHKAGADRSSQSKSQQTRKILVLQLLQTMSAVRP